MMKKFALISALFMAMAFPALSYAADSFYVTTVEVINGISRDIEIESNDSGDVSSVTVTFHAPYMLNSISDAMSFAENPSSSTYVTTYTSSLRTTYGSSVSINTNLPSFGGTAVIVLSKDDEAANIDTSSLSSLTITGNGHSISASSGMRHFTVGGNFTLNNATLNGLSVGGGAVVNGGTANFNNVTFTAITTSSNGGALSVSGGAVNISECNFSANTSTGSSGGGAIYVSGGTVNISGGTSFANNTGSNGGAIYVYGGQVTVSDNPSFQANGSTASNGGAVYVANGTISFSGSPTFMGNGVSSNGGAICIIGGTANLNGTGVSFTSNDAGLNGGAVYISGGTANLHTSTFTDNRAVSNGGGLYVSGGTVSLPTATFTGNGAARGGGVYASSKITFTGNANFTSNFASSDNGGGIFVSSSAGSSNSLTFSGPVTFSRNTAGNGGGALYTEGYTTFSDTSRFETNSADVGGGVYVSGSAEFSGNATFSDNIATSDGGGMYASGNAAFAGTPSFTGNYSMGGNGGAMYITDNGNIEFSGSGSVRFTGSNRAVNGGAVYMAGKLTFTGSPTFSNNYTTNGSGGAVYIANYSSALLTINGTSEMTFSNNNSSKHGGALYIAQSGRASFTPEVTFTENRANNGNGGAVWVHTLSRISHSENINFNDNRASKDISSTTVDPYGAAAGNGGALFIGATSRNPRTMLDNSYKFGGEIGNWAYNSGGAVCSASSDITINSMTITDMNTAETGGGGFVNAGMGSSDITISNSTIRNQTARSGGALRGSNITVSSADFYTNHSTGTGSVYDDGGGAIFANGILTTNNVRFYSNDVTGARAAGGAVVCVTAKMADTLFTRNVSNANGGALSIMGAGSAYSEISRTSFTSNRTGGSQNTLGSGGAIMAFGNVSMDKCYIASNTAYVNGGAISYAQFGGNAGTGVFRITNSMLEENNTGLTAGTGGAIYVHANQAIIDSCTFNHNQGRNAEGSAGGGAIYLESAGSNESMITNSTFVRNAFPTSNGGALAFTGTVRVRACTFSMGNSAGTGKGGGIYISRSSTLYIDSTIVVGNEGSLGADIWSENGTVNNDRGYNRIGIYGAGNSNTSWRLSVGGTTDREATDSGVSLWETATFFGRNAALADNIVPGDTSKPPVVGYEVTKHLQTLMLSEDANLRASYRATNIIPYDQAAFYLQYDERGRDRRALGTNIDIGACFNDNAVRTNLDEEDTNRYAISYVQLSGIPNNFRQIGQTAHIIARVYYVNGTYSDDAKVVWGISPSGSSVLSYDQRGNYTVMNPGTAYITVRTQAAKNDGTYATASYAVIVTNVYSGVLNTSTTYYRNLFRTYQQNFDEYQITFDYPSSGTSSVSSSTFQSSFSSVWGVSASLLTAYAESASSYATFTPARTGYSSSGYEVANSAGVNINYPNRSKGDIMPVVYTWTFASKDVRNILGYDLSGDINSDTAYERIFQTLRLDFTGNGSTRPVVGAGGVSASNARSNGVLNMMSDSSGRLIVQLTAYLANVSAGTGKNAQLMSSSLNDAGGVLMRSAGGKILVVPDGSDTDNAISGTMWAARKTSVNAPTSESSGGGGGGGGCSSMGLILPAIALVFILKRR